MGIRDYRDLEVWRLGVDLAVAAYAVSKHLPSSERFGLVSQVQRAAISIPANIAEGRRTTGEFLNHLSIVYGSLKELETQLVLAERLGFLTDTQLGDCRQRTERIGRRLSGLMAKLRARDRA